MIKKLAFISLLVLLMVVGCSRKPDEEPTANVGDLRVRFQVKSNLDLPATFPVTVSVFADSAHTPALAPAPKTVTAVKDSIFAVEFYELKRGFMWVQFHVGAAGITNADCPEDMSVIVQLNKMITTPIRIMTVYQSYTSCVNLDAP